MGHLCFTNTSCFLSYSGDTTFIIAIISVKRSTGLTVEEKTETDEVAVACIQEELDAVGDLDEM